ncbi:uncharacterized protein AAG666_017902 [Megaptera novaeangliae]
MAIPRPNTLRAPPGAPTFPGRCRGLGPRGPASPNPPPTGPAPQVRGAGVTPAQRTPRPTLASARIPGLRGLSGVRRASTRGPTKTGAGLPLSTSVNLAFRSMSTSPKQQARLYSQDIRQIRPGWEPRLPKPHHVPGALRHQGNSLVALENQNARMG